LWKLTELWKNQRTVFPQLLEPSVHTFHNAGCCGNFKHNFSCTPADTTRARIRMRRFRDGTARSSYEVPDKRMEQRRCVKEPDSMSQPVDGRSPRKKAALVKKVVFDEV
jgi:hypothetical protein